MIDYWATNIINAALHLDLRSAAGLDEFRKIVQTALVEATNYKGTERLALAHTCLRCNGTGVWNYYDNPVPCPDCNASGRRYQIPKQPKGE